MALYRTSLTGKSRAAFWETGKGFPVRKLVKLRFLAENSTFVLPANVALTGRIWIRNNSANTQAAITIGTSAGGTQIDAGATTATVLTAIRAGTKLDPAATDRTIYVESSAWQAGVHVMLEAEELPVSASTDALS